MWEDATADRDDGDFMEHPITEEYAGEQLAKYLLDLKRHGTLTAASLCIICHWATAAGAKGVINELAQPPHLNNSGRYSEWVDTVLGTDLAAQHDWYELPIPVYSRRSDERVVEFISVIPPHDLLDLEIAEGKAIPALEDAKAKGLLPPCYYRHPVVQSAPADVPVMPIAFYLDGVDCTRYDSALGLWVYFTVTGKRKLVAVMRKSQDCRCGCGGWCSHYPLFKMMHWSAVAMSQGRYPSHRHDGTEFFPEEGARKAVAGDSFTIPWRGAIIYLKGDLMEFTATYGFASFSHNEHPCILCHGNRNDDSLKSTDGLSPNTFPVRLKTHAEYCNSCTACEITKNIVHRRDHMRIRSSLWSDRGKKARGLALKVDVLGLLTHDRLEPHQDCANVWDFENLDIPCTTHWWRVSAETGTHHRNPLLDATIGVTMESCMCIDFLHCVALGVMQDFAPALIHELIYERNVYCVPGLMENRMVVSMNAIAAEASEFFRSEARHGRHFTEPPKLDQHTFGTHLHHKCRLMGGATMGFIAFSKRLIEKHSLQLPNAGRWARCVSYLMSLRDMCKDNPHIFPISVQQANL